MAGTAHADSACHRATVEILTARLRAPGHPHDAHVRDRPHSSRKARRFWLEAGGAGRV